MNLQSKWAKVLTRLLSKYTSAPVILDWKPLMQILKAHHLKKLRSTEYNGRAVELFHGTSIKKLIHKARKFFPEETCREIIQEITPNLCPHDSLIFQNQALLTLFVPTHHKSFDPEWISQLLATFSWIENSKGWEKFHLALLSRIAKHQIGNIDWTPHLPQLFT